MNETQLPDIEPSEGSIELIEALQRQLKDHDVRCSSQRAKLVSDLARQQALHAAREAERTRQRELRAAAAELDSARCEYDRRAAAAAAAFDELYAISCRAAVVFKAAVQAERAKREALPALTSAWQTMRQLDRDAIEPKLDQLYEFNFDARDPRRGIASTALEVFPELRRELTRLGASAETTTVPATVAAAVVTPPPVAKPAAIPPFEADPLEVIARRLQARQQHDSIRRQCLTRE
ncbi:MAG TPA: hypothetical protein VGH89_06165 [Pseudonocardia sp.]